MSKKKAAAKKPAAKKPRAVKPAEVYVVERITMGYEGTVNGEPERVFAGKAAAVKFAAERTLAARAFTNPFEWNTGPIITGGETKLAAVITKLGLKPPTKKKGEYGINWSRWWDQTYEQMSEQQRDAIWDALDKKKLYRVVKNELEG
jgi:hypothetical protein